MKVKFGLKNVHVFPMTEQTDSETGAITMSYGSAIAIPGAVNLYEIFSIYSAFPAMYPPLKAILPPGFLIREPTIISAPTSVGSLVSANSP